MSTRRGQRCPKSGKKGCRGARWCEKFSSIPEKRLLTLSSASLWYREKPRLCSPMSWPSCRASSGETSRSCSPDLMEHGGGWQRAERRRVQGLVSLSRLHLQQPQHGRVVSELHPPLGGQADVFSQVVYSSYAPTKKRKETLDRWETPRTCVLFTLISLL